MIPEPVRDLEPSEVGAAADLIVDAFFDDPFWTYVFPDPGARRRLGPRLAACLVRSARLAGRAWTTPGLEGIALRRTPERLDVTPLEVLRCGLAFAPLTIGPGAFRRTLQLVDELESRHREAAPKLPRHWLAWILAVSPGAQGRGHGGELMRHTFASARGAGLYLETFTEKNVEIHAAHGYRLLTDRRVPRTALRLWTMFRDPQ